MLSLEIELLKRNIRGKKHSLCLFCYNKMLIKYDKEKCIEIIIEILDGTYLDPDMNMDNIFEICIKQILIPDVQYIIQFIELLHQNTILETMDDIFMGKLGQKLKTINHVEINQTLIENYCSNQSEENTFILLNMLHGMVENNILIDIERNIDNCIDYIARCNVFNETPNQIDIIEMLDEYIKIQLKHKLYYHNDMLKLCNLIQTLYDSTIDTAHLLFQHSFFCNSKLSMNVKYICCRKRYENEHVRENMSKIKHLFIHEESRIIEIDKLVETLKRKITNPTEEEENIFKKINTLLIEVMVSIKNELI